MNKVRTFVSVCVCVCLRERERERDVFALDEANKNQV